MYSVRKIYFCAICIGERKKKETSIEPFTFMTQTRCPDDLRWGGAGARAWSTRGTAGRGRGRPRRTSGRSGSCPGRWRLLTRRFPLGRGGAYRSPLEPRQSPLPSVWEMLSPVSTVSLAASTSQQVLSYVYVNLLINYYTHILTLSVI
jgi:hypothetical protein